MKHLIIATGCLFAFLLSSGQNGTLKVMVDSLSFIPADTLDCRAGLYWRIVAAGSKAIPLLMDKLGDMMPTTVSFHCKGIKLTTGELAYFALNEIAPVPVYAIAHTRFDFSDNEGCRSFYRSFFDSAYGAQYRALVKAAYDNNKRGYKRRRISRKRQTACQQKYKIHNYYTAKG